MTVPAIPPATTSRRAFPRRVLSHWHHLFEAQYSSKEFYAAVESALATRQVPGLEQSRLDFHEGGLLSSKREYLRFQRERLVFDICAAPFGTGFFVSWRLLEVPLPLRLWHFFVLWFALALPFYLCTKVFGVGWGFLVFVALLGLGVWHLRTLLARGLEDVDAALMRTPVLGPIYERFLRPLTYFRIDLALMYQESAHSAVLDAADALTSATGAKPLTGLERKPIMRELYRR